MRTSDLTPTERTLLELYRLLSKHPEYKIGLLWMFNQCRANMVLAQEFEGRLAENWRDCPVNEGDDSE